MYRVWKVIWGGSCKCKKSQKSDSFRNFVSFKNPLSECDFIHFPWNGNGTKIAYFTLCWVMTHPCSVRRNLISPLLSPTKSHFGLMFFQNHFVGIIFMIILEEQNRNIIKLCLVLYSTFIVTKVEVRRACFTLPYRLFESVSVWACCVSILISN